MMIQDFRIIRKSQTLFPLWEKRWWRTTDTWGLTCIDWVGNDATRRNKVDF